jgi:hypothetical protein
VGSGTAGGGGGICVGDLGGGGPVLCSEGSNRLTRQISRVALNHHKKLMLRDNLFLKQKFGCLFRVII